MRGPSVLKPSECWAAPAVIGHVNRIDSRCPVGDADLNFVDTTVTWLQNDEFPRRAHLVTAEAVGAGFDSDYELALGHHSPLNEMREGFPRVPDLHRRAVDGVSVPIGCDVMLLLGAGNRDPARYREPDRFTTRADNKPLSIGAGAHICIAKQLRSARGIGGFPRLLDRFPGLSAAPGRTPARRQRRVLREYQTLPVQLEALDYALHHPCAVTITRVARHRCQECDVSGRRHAHA